MDLLLFLAAGLIVVFALAIGEAEAATRSKPSEVMLPKRQGRLPRVGHSPDPD